MIRTAAMADLPAILEVYAYAREYMVQTGNPTQWGKVYPDEELLGEDIENQRLFLLEERGVLHGVFYFVIGPDPTYALIENGSWRSDAPYGTIHRIAAAQGARGVFGRCMEYCLEQIGHLRIDTHEDNKVMQHTLEKHGFVPRGTIYTDNGTPRIAYDYIRP